MSVKGTAAGTSRGPAAEGSGSYEAGYRVRLPNGAERPISVFINGIEQTELTDYKVIDREVVFARPIVKERVGKGRWLAMWLGLFGSYAKNETVDLHFRHGGRSRVVSDAKVLPD